MSIKLATKAHSGDAGFTLVELMVVVLIIGILISIGTPVFYTATKQAQSKSCQSNQRAVAGTIQMYFGTLGHPVALNSGPLAFGGSDWFALLVPDWISNGPVCPGDRAPYLMTAQGDIVGDRGLTLGFKSEHALE